MLNVVKGEGDTIDESKFEILLTFIQIGTQFLMPHFCTITSVNFFHPLNRRQEILEATNNK